jgi:beta-lactamase class A
VPAPPAALTTAERLAAVVAGFSGRIGWHAVELDSGRVLTERADERFGTASVIKVGLVAYALDLVARGALDLDEPVQLPPRAERVTGGGILKLLDAGVFSLRDLCELTIVVSDNAATNAVLDRCGGAEGLNAWLDGLGLRETRMPGPVDFTRITHDVDGAIGVSTPRETTALLARVARGRLALAAELEGMLRRQHLRDQAARWLGDNPYDQWHTGRDPDLVVANKTGELDGIRNDVAVVRLRGRGTVCLSVYTNEGADLRETVDNEGNLAVVAAAAALLCRDLLGLDAHDPRLLPRA